MGREAGGVSIITTRKKSIEYPIEYLDFSACSAEQALDILAEAMAELALDSTRLLINISDASFDSRFIFKLRGLRVHSFCERRKAALVGSCNSRQALKLYAYLCNFFLIRVFDHIEEAMDWLVGEDKQIGTSL